jgi:hypothetical protein
MNNSFVRAGRVVYPEEHCQAEWIFRRENRGSIFA